MTWKPTLSDPRPGIRPVSLEEQWEAARTVVRAALRAHGIPEHGPFDDLPDKLLDELDQVLRELDLVFVEIWPREEPDA